MFFPWQLSPPLEKFRLVLLKKIENSSEPAEKIFSSLSSPFSNLSRELAVP
jgi:hypothetical protein